MIKTYLFLMYKNRKLKIVSLKIISIGANMLLRFMSIVTAPTNV